MCYLLNLATISVGQSLRQRREAIIAMGHPTRPITDYYNEASDPPYYRLLQ